MRDVAPTMPQGPWSVWWEQVKENRMPVFETVHRTRDGRLVPKEVSVNYLKVGEREICYGLARDISERKRAHEALRASEQRLRLMVEHLPAGAVYREGGGSCSSSTGRPKRSSAIRGKPSPPSTPGSTPSTPTRTSRCRGITKRTGPPSGWGNWWTACWSSLW